MCKWKDLCLYFHLKFLVMLKVNLVTFRSAETLNKYINKTLHVSNRRNERKRYLTSCKNLL